VNRTFFGRFQIGEFDSSRSDSQLEEWRSYGNETVFSQPHQDVAKDSARQSVVLLRNAGNLLPLQPGKRIAVVGPNGNASDVFFGQYHGAVCPGEPTDGSHTVPHRCD
jgi:beta-glucosidase-like glycosyl hydrolase